MIVKIQNVSGAGFHESNWGKPNFAHQLIDGLKRFDRRPDCVVLVGGWNSWWMSEDEIFAHVTELIQIFENA